MIEKNDNPFPVVESEQDAIAETIRKSPVLRIVYALCHSDLSRRGVRVAQHILLRSLNLDGTVTPAFISLKEFWTYAHVSATHACDIRTELVKKNVITVTYPDTGRLPFYAVVPDPTEWLVWDEDESAPEESPDRG